MVSLSSYHASTSSPTRPMRSSSMKSRIRSFTIPFLFAALLLFISSTDARSPHPPPLKRIHTPSTSSLQIIPRQKSDKLSYRSHAPYPHPRTLRHDDTFFLTIDLPELLPESVHLLMRPTEDFFHPNAKITYGDGTSEPLRKEDWRLYTGDVIRSNWKDRLHWEESLGLGDDTPSSRRKEAILGGARIHVLHPGSMDVNPIFEGVFTVNGVNYNVLTKEHYEKVKTVNDIEAGEVGDLIVFRDADAWHDNDDHAQHPMQAPKCSHDALDFNSNASHPVLSAFAGDDILGNLFKRDDLNGMAPTSNYAGSIGNTQGCPSTQQVVYMGVALDCNYVQTYGTAERAREQILTVFNQASALYRQTFNISLGIVELIVQNNTCSTSAPQGREWDVSCEQNLTLDQRLSLFSQWRGSRGEDGVGLWHLMSACPTDTEVGVAWLGTLCTTTSTFQSGSYVSGTGVSTATRNEWSLVAHEVGHNFGAIHDCSTGCSLSGSCCPLTATTCDAGGRYIMNPTTSETEETFSPCSIGNICSGLGNRLVSSTCIEQPGTRVTISLQQCGNGIVDDGEECDPGTNGDSTCCDPQTCRFREGAVCDPSNAACCTGSCQFAAAGTVCRASIHATCDMAETCTGNNATCPPDRTAEDGTSCGDGNLACASGRCTSLDQQCQNAGISMNLTRACGQRNDRSCVISCRDPRISNQCIVLETPLIDGSPCGYGGHCYNQTCQSGSWQSTAASWYTSNLQISVPVTVVVGLIVLGILFAIARCIFRGGCCGSRKARNGPITPTRQSMLQRGSNRNTMATGPLPPPPQRNSDSSVAPMTQQYGDYNGGPGTSPPRNNRGSMLPPPPPPTHQYNYGQQNGYPSSSYNNNNYNQGGYVGNGPYGGGGGGNGWVDESLYNGPNYGRQEAWGR